MAESLKVHSRNLAHYLNANVLDQDELSSADILDALASVGITLVEDPISDSAHTYYESFPKPDQGPILDGP